MEKGWENKKNWKSLRNVGWNGEYLKKEDAVNFLIIKGKIWSGLGNLKKIKTMVVQ